MQAGGHWLTWGEEGHSVRVLGEGRARWSRLPSPAGARAWVLLTPLGAWAAPVVTRHPSGLGRDGGAGSWRWEPDRVAGRMASASAALPRVT